MLIGVLASATLAQQSAAPEAAPAPAASTQSEFAGAHKLMQQGKLDEAIAQLQAVEARDPATKGLALELGTAYYKKSDFPKAIEYLKKANAEDPNNEEAVQLLGMSYFAGGHPADAIPLLEKVQGWISRANVDGYYILGNCYIQTRNYDQARHAFGKMFDVPGDSAAAYLFTARMLLRQEYDPIAEEYALKAAALDPKLPLVHFLLGELYLYKSRLPGVDRGISEGVGHQSGACRHLLQARGRVLAHSEIRRRPAPVTALDPARPHVERALHSDG